MFSPAHNALLLSNLDYLSITYKKTSAIKIILSYDRRFGSVFSLIEVKVVE